MNSVYLIVNIVNGKKYVGKTEKTVQERFNEHLAEARRGSNRRICQAIRKHGTNSFRISVLEMCSLENSSTCEKKWIAHLNTRDYKHGYNMTDGGEGKAGALVTNKTRAKISSGVKARITALTVQQRREMTVAANAAKRGKKENSSLKKSDAQKKRWAAASIEERLIHGKKTAQGVTLEGKKRQIAGMNTAFSPVRTKGYKQPIVTCPYCSKQGGRSLMKRNHFEKCKSR